MAWVPVNRSVFTHRKTMKLADVLDIPEVYAVGHLVALWTWAMDNAPTGSIPSNTSARMLARAAEFPGNPQTFVDALTEAEYLAQTEDGYEIPNWMEYGGKLLVQQEKDKAHWESLSLYAHHKEEVFERDGYACVYCGSPLNLSLDHVIPQSRGGSHEPTNLVTCCRSCNSSKGDKTPAEWKRAQSK